MGLALFLFGTRREAKRRQRVGTTAAQPFPVFNFNRPEHRRWLAYLTGGGLIMFSVVGTLTYNAYVYTGSTKFCGTTCHVPMTPEYTAYLDSSHARVPCVDCHIGSGAGFFVKAKVNGAKQVVLTWLNSYDRPIPITTQELRPARDTCEKCHWPDKSYGAKLKQVPHFRYDEYNTAEQITFTMRIGGGNPEHGESAGIHWHMLIDNEVTYGALDHELQDIPWTAVKHKDGSVTRYVSTAAKVSKDKLDGLEPRTMDCMDCHNRPAHTFPVPDRAIDEAMYHGQIDETIPWIKKVAVEVVNLHHADEDGGAEAVARDVVAHYQKELPDVFAKRQPDIEQAAQVAAAVWKRSAFPDMKVTWKTYPSNIGHRYWPGCFRCHDGKHVSEEGKVLEKTCDGQCHTAPARGAIEPLGFVDPLADTEDWHPWEMPAEHLKIQAHKNVACYQCHEAGKRPSADCKDCHESQR
jgi:nitrate/TMAO reductase-like tetraheme cytochrome c subunit